MGRRASSSLSPAVIIGIVIVVILLVGGGAVLLRGKKESFEGAPLNMEDFMSNANSQWIMDESGKDHFIVGFLNAGHVSLQEDGRYKAVSRCGTGLYGWAMRYFESQDDAYEWVATLWAQSEARAPKNF